jgi:hypothetical protein
MYIDPREPNLSQSHICMFRKRFVPSLQKLKILFSKPSIADDASLKVN